MCGEKRKGLPPRFFLHISMSELALPQWGPKTPYIVLCSSFLPSQEPFEVGESEIV